MRDLGVDNGFNELSEGFGVEFLHSDLSLELPGLTVDVEYALAKKVVNSSTGIFAFSVVIEVGHEDVLDYGGVAGDDEAGGEGLAENEGVGG